MCDPVPSHPDNNYACIQCGSQVEYEGGLICDACQRRLKGQPWPALKAEQEFPVEPSPALPPTGAAPSNPAGPVSLDMAAVELRAAAASLDPGLQSDRWSLHQQQFGGPHAGKLKKVGQPLDPKDLMINVGFVDARCKVILTHKPTRLFCEEEGPADQKEAIHSRLYGELKRKVENLLRDSERLEKALVDSMRTVRISHRLSPATRELVVGFAEAMADKLLAAQDKYGYWDGWSDPDFIPECRTHLREHLSKGDPRDVANYCAFLWWHKASTVPTELLAAGARTVPEPLKSAIMELVCAFEFMVVEELSGTSQHDTQMALADKVRGLMGVKVPDPEEPSSQVHPDSGLPSRRPE